MDFVKSGPVGGRVEAQGVGIGQDFGHGGYGFEEAARGEGAGDGFEQAADASASGLQDSRELVDPSEGLQMGGGWSR